MAINIEKSGISAELSPDIKSKKVEEMKATILSICQTISSPSNKFDVKEAFNEIKQYVKNYDRLLYAEISTYCYNLSSENTDTFQGNLNSLIEYVYSKDYENGIKAERGNHNQDEIDLRERTKRIVIKLYDNVNLACAQLSSLKQSSDELHQHFISEFEPAKSEITKEVSSQLITLVGIFTAIAFLVFGGFSSLSDVFSHIGDSIEKTIMLASLWGLIICNGVFVFLGCVERIVKKDSASQFFTKNKMFSWTNLILLFIFANALWSSIVDAYNWGGSIITFCQNLRQFIAPLGFVTILIVFAIAAFCSTKKEK